MAISDAQFNELVKRVSALEDFVSKKKIQQIDYPLDSASQKVINNIVIHP